MMSDKLHSFIQQIFSKHVPGARHSKNVGVNRTDWGLAIMDLRVQLEILINEILL